MTIVVSYEDEVKGIVLFQGLRLRSSVAGRQSTDKSGVAYPGVAFMNSNTYGALTTLMSTFSTLCPPFFLSQYP